ncbi:MAG: hypothetical protein A3F11_06940 [Gammaproteobacteria bacterium RIFCSPHIGHO2_12_FULL_37_14]|nr:MAG: hypothetical protein A3F11_06940 [Gammaproteobacteria bacterium RIFCSPHIGHO2_12_FULL_37_14]
MTKTILCYGDSNTWGYIAGKFNLQTQYMERYPRDIRWTGRLQKLLGDDYYVIEEGLNGRTTNVDSDIPPERNGKNYLLPCLYTHSPLDLVVLMLGGNDLKKIFNRSVDDIVNGLSELTHMIQSTKYGRGMQSPPKILLVGYPTLTHDNAGEFYGDKNMFENGVKRSKEFDAHISKMAKQNDCYYFNMAPYVEFSEVDGLHFDEEGHKIFAEKIAPEITKIIG